MAAVLREKKDRPREARLGEMVLYELPSSGVLRPAFVIGTAPDGGMMLRVLCTPTEIGSEGDFVPGARFGERGDDGKIGPGRWTWRT